MIKIYVKTWLVWSKERVFSATITENGGILFYQDWISMIKYDWFNRNSNTEGKGGGWGGVSLFIEFEINFGIWNEEVHVHVYNHNKQTVNHGYKLWYKYDYV